MLKLATIETLNIKDNFHKSSSQDGITTDTENKKSLPDSVFTDLDMFLLISKRIMTASRVYANTKPQELEDALKNVLRDIVKKTDAKPAKIITDDLF